MKQDPNWDELWIAANRAIFNGCRDDVYIPDAAQERAALAAPVEEQLPALAAPVEERPQPQLTRPREIKAEPVEEQPKKKLRVKEEQLDHEEPQDPGHVRGSASGLHDNVRRSPSREIMQRLSSAEMMYMCKEGDWTATEICFFIRILVNRLVPSSPVRERR